MKVYIRTLWGNDAKPLWGNDAQREALRLHLNEQGFYVLTGAGDSLEVSAIEYYQPWDIKFLEKTLDKLSKAWYTIVKHKEAGQ